MPVVDAGGRVLGILSAGQLMSLEALSPFALRQTLLTARTESDLVKTASEVPKLFIDLIEADLDARAVTRILTLLSDAMTTRLDRAGHRALRRAARRLRLARLRQHRAQ